MPKEPKLLSDEEGTENRINLQSYPGVLNPCRNCMQVSSIKSYLEEERKQKARIVEAGNAILTWIFEKAHNVETGGIPEELYLNWRKAVEKGEG